MSDTVKLIIEIPRNEYEYTCERTLSDRTFWDDAIRNGIPLDVVKAEIDYERNLYLNLVGDSGYCNGLNKALKIIDNIGKESEGEK